MALEGSLQDFGLADILQLIYFQRKTGILSLDGRTDNVKLQFLEGNIVGAESKRRNEDNRLGKVLVKKGLITEEDLKSVLEEQKRTGAKLGTLLIKRELSDREKVREILNNQITETVVQLFSWKQGTYEFTAKGVAQDKDIPFSLDTQHLLMEGLRIVDELSVIKDRITLDTLFVKKGGDIGMLTDEERDILEHIDGQNDVSTIIELVGRDSYEVSRDLLSLLEKGLIDAGESAPVAAIDLEKGAPETRISLSYLPYIAVALSVVLSLSVMFLQNDDVLKVLNASKKIRELRFEIDAYRYKHTAYPPSLSSITKEPDPWGRPYIYSASEQGFTVKSSGPDRSEGTGDDIF